MMSTRTRASASLRAAKFTYLAAGSACSFKPGGTITEFCAASAHHITRSSIDYLPGTWSDDLGITRLGELHRDGLPGLSGPSRSESARSGSTTCRWLRSSLSRPQLEAASGPRHNLLGPCQWSPAHYRQLYGAARAISTAVVTSGSQSSKSGPENPAVRRGASDSDAHSLPLHAASASDGDDPSSSPKSSSSSSRSGSLPSIAPQSHPEEPPTTNPNLSYATPSVLPDPLLAVRPGQHQTPIVDSLWASRSAAMDAGPLAVDETTGLVTYAPSHSRTKVVYRFSTDPLLADMYANPWGKVRVGKILEDLDALAGNIAARHCFDQHGMRPENLLLVTACVDHITVKRQFAAMSKDMELSGAVTFVGSSSIQILMKAKSDGAPRPWISAQFTFVARNKDTDSAFKVNRLEPQTKEEISLYQAAQRWVETRRLVRQHNSASSPLAVEHGRWKSIPGFIHDVEASAKSLLSDAQPLSHMRSLVARHAVLYRETCLENSLICQPQQRNTSGRVFGGFLMRRGFELAFATAYLFGGARPHVVEVDEVVFRKPVDIGNMLQLRSGVLYTSVVNNQPHIHVEVIANVTRPEQRSSVLSNTFNFTFSLDPGIEVAKVYPASMDEARRIVSRMQADMVQAAESADLDSDSEPQPEELP